MKERLQLLRAEIQTDRAALAEHVVELRTLDLGPHGTGGDLARAAVALHHGYSAIETMFQRVARAFDGGEPLGTDWHQNLLSRMALEIDGVRPAVLGEESLALLRALLAFRHFFRHAYAVRLDRTKLSTVRDQALQMAPLLSRDLDRLDQLLVSLIGDERPAE